MRDREQKVRLAAARGLGFHSGTLELVEKLSQVLRAEKSSFVLTSVLDALARYSKSSGRALSEIAQFTTQCGDPEVRAYASKLSNSLGIN